jgi:hypothetical protein
MAPDMAWPSITLGYGPDGAGLWDGAQLCQHALSRPQGIAVFGNPDNYTL